MIVKTLSTSDDVLCYMIGTEQSIIQALLVKRYMD